MMFACHANDVGFANDVRFANDVWLRHILMQTSHHCEQIGRSGTSIGANIHEAQYAQGTKDFISKFEIALKEASETL